MVKQVFLIGFTLSALSVAADSFCTFTKVDTVDAVSGKGIIVAGTGACGPSFSDQPAVSNIRVGFARTSLDSKCADLAQTAFGNQTQFAISGSSTALTDRLSIHPNRCIDFRTGQPGLCQLPGGTANGNPSIYQFPKVCSGTVLATGSMDNHDDGAFAQTQCNNARAGLIAQNTPPTCCMYQLAGAGSWAVTNGEPVSAEAGASFYQGDFNTNHLYVFASSCLSSF